MGASDPSAGGPPGTECAGDPRAAADRSRPRRSGASSGTWVVHAASPRAMVASRWTCVPSSSENALVSASQSSGNSVATWAIGQWCWHSCAPGPAAADLADLRSVAPGGQHSASAASRACAPRPMTSSRRGRSGAYALGGETVDGALARVLGQEASAETRGRRSRARTARARRREQVVPGSGRPRPRGPAPGCVAQLGLSGLDQRVEMPCGPQAPTAPARPRPPPRCTVPAPSAAGRRRCGCGPRDGPPRHRCRDRRPLLRPGPRRTGAGSRTEAGPAAFHNTSVTYIRLIGKADPPEKGEAG